MEYIYKYVDDSSKVVYVGITNNMEQRVQQHKKDKLKIIENPVIYYFPVKFRADADILETYLINHYNTGKYYNVAKANRGEVSFLDIELPWKMYRGITDKKMDPFVLSDYIPTKIVTVNKFVETKNVDAIIKKSDNDIHEIDDYLKTEIKKEIIITNYLMRYRDNKFCNKGWVLHNKRLKAFCLYRRHFLDVINPEKERKLKAIIVNTNKQIDIHETNIGG